MRYIRKNLGESIHSWGRDEMILALLGYILLAVLAAYPVSRLGGSLEVRLSAALAVAACGWLLILLLIVTPARMWYAAQARIEDLEASQASSSPNPSVASMKGLVNVSGGSHVEFSNSHFEHVDKRVITPLSTGKDWLNASRIEGESFRLVDIPRSGQIIESKEFVDCEIHGPAVIVLLDGILEQSTFESSPETLFIPFEGQKVTGVTALKNCRILRCRIKNDIAILAPKAIISSTLPQIACGPTIRPSPSERR